MALFEKRRSRTVVKEIKSTIDKIKGEIQMIVNKFIPMDIDQLQEKEVIQATVKGIQPYGVFLETESGIVGLLHIEDISIARMKSPAERFKIGQKIEVMVKSIDREKKKVLFTHKELLGTWKENAEKFEEGTKVQGIVRETEKNHNGIFVELTPNLVGMAEYKENLEYGQPVEVYIKKIIPDKQKIKLVIL